MIKNTKTIAMTSLSLAAIAWVAVIFTLTIDTSAVLSIGTLLTAFLLSVVTIHFNVKEEVVSKEENNDKIIMYAVVLAVASMLGVVLCSTTTSISVVGGPTIGITK